MYRLKLFRCQCIKLPQYIQILAMQEYFEIFIDCTCFWMSMLVNTKSLTMHDSHLFGNLRIHWFITGNFKNCNLVAKLYFICALWLPPSNLFNLNKFCRFYCKAQTLLQFGSRNTSITHREIPQVLCNSSILLRHIVYNMNVFLYPA